MAAGEEPHPPPNETEGRVEEPFGGERLAEARRARGVSLRDIAKELHLDEPKVRAIEENRFDDLGAPVFAKGHMRKYAELVGVPFDDVLADYYRIHRTTGAPPIVGPRSRTRPELNIAPWILGLIILMLAASATWWWFDRSERRSGQPVPKALDAGNTASEASAPVDDQTEAARVEAVSPVVEPDRAEPGPSRTEPGPSRTEPEPSLVEPGPSRTEPQPSLVEPGPSLAQPSPAESELEGPVAAGQTVEIELTFTGDCWAEVIDATGERLYFDLGRAGRTVTVNGVAPVRMLLGDSNAVGIRVDGLEYPIPPASRQGNMARLTIAGQSQ